MNVQGSDDALRSKLAPSWHPKSSMKRKEVLAKGQSNGKKKRRKKTVMADRQAEQKPRSGDRGGDMSTDGREQLWQRNEQHQKARGEFGWSPEGGNHRGRE